MQNSNANTATFFFNRNFNYNYNYDEFSSRFSMIASVLAAAIGTGNVWRMSRITAQNATANGGGAFILLWSLFLLFFAIPLVLLELGIGKYTRKGVIESFNLMVGPHTRFLGLFISIANILVTAYYSVVVAYCLGYLALAIFYPLPDTNVVASENWDSFISSPFPVLLHAIVVLLTFGIIRKGISTIEYVCTRLVPLLLVILTYIAIRALTLKNAMDGVGFVFGIDTESFMQPSLYLQALAQICFDTGAGWAIFLSFATHMQESHDIVSVSIAIPIMNNIISLMCVLTTFATCFSVLKSEDHLSDKEILDIIKDSGPASTGLTFIWTPVLFGKLEYGRILSIFYFFGLFLAGLGSLTSQFNMQTVALTNYGLSQLRSTAIVSLAVFLIGIASAISPSFLSNQDYVWGTSGLICGLLLCFSASSTIGVTSFRIRVGFLNEYNLIGIIWDVLIKYFIPLQIIILLVWSLFVDGFLSSSSNNSNWYSPFQMNSVGTVFYQWGIIFAICFGVRHKLTPPSLSNNSITTANTNNNNDAGSEMGAFALDDGADDGDDLIFSAAPEVQQQQQANQALIIQSK